MPKPHRLHGAIIGLDGFIGRNHMSAARSCITPRMDVDICVPGKPEDYEKNLELTDRMGFDREFVFPTVEAMLEANLEIDFAIVALPNYLHKACCLKLAEAGIHIVCDKPLAMNAAEADEMVGAILSRGLKSLCTPTYIGHPPFLEAQQRLVWEDERINLRGGRAVYDQVWLRKKLAEMSADEGLMQAIWRKDPAKAGSGALGDLISHLLFEIYFMTWLPITQAWGEMRWVVEGPNSNTTDDQTTCGIRLGEDIQITIESTQWAGGHTNDIEWQLWLKGGKTYGWSQDAPEFLVEGDNGTRILHPRCDFKTPILPATNTMPAGHGDGWRDADGRLMSSFGWDILGVKPEVGGNPIELYHPDFRVGRNIMAVIDAIVTSARGDTPRQWVDVDWKHYD